MAELCTKYGVRNPPAQFDAKEWTSHVLNSRATNTREIVMSNAENTRHDERDEKKSHDSAASAGSESQEEGEAAMDAAEEAVVDHGRD
ncbi:hypothetical protein GCM10009862_19540 [Microbacterium binotii]|uniref:Uncharacterized protein n=1 Tax=Microbacterium binotii TaxID=462710 RepID=A0ABN3PFJ2_9MICO